MRWLGGLVKSLIKRRKHVYTIKKGASRKGFRWTLLDHVGKEIAMAHTIQALERLKDILEAR